MKARQALFVPLDVHALSTCLWTGVGRQSLADATPEPPTVASVQAWRGQGPTFTVTNMAHCTPLENEICRNLAPVGGEWARESLPGPAVNTSEVGSTAAVQAVDGPSTASRTHSMSI